MGLLGRRGKVKIFLAPSKQCHSTFGDSSFSALQQAFAIFEASSDMNTLKKALWMPSAPSETNVAKFISYVNQKRNLQIQTYGELHEWSVNEKTLLHFWEDAYLWLELSPGVNDVGCALSSQVIEDGALFPPPQFFPDCTLNIAELILRSHKDNDVAIYFSRESATDVSRITWGELRHDVARIRDAMLSSGVESGDVIAAVISNSVSAICICLATISIGAVWSSSSPDLGSEAIVDRYAQVHPKLIFADDGYVYAGKLIPLQSRIAEWSKAMAGQDSVLQDVVIVPYCKLEVEWPAIQCGCSLETFLRRACGRPLDFRLVPFSHPAFILYSSGTTGKPKCIVHSAGGAALKARTDSILQHDLRQNDVVFQYTTTSWVMWVLNFLNLGVGSSLLLYDGSPFHPSPTVLLQLAQDVGVTVFGTSPRYLTDIKSRGIVPRKQFNLNKLRILTSTGAVLSAKLSEWFYHEAFPPHAQLISMSGGTDIAGSFVGGTPILPVYAGEIQVKALGMAVDILDAAQTEPISIEHSGAIGELVCTKPFPSQPLTFLGNGGIEKYESSYFTRFGPGVWYQGDLAQRFTDTGGIAMLGRSDGVLNPSGVRFGSAEIYAVTETFPEVKDSICVGQQRERDANERVLLFVVMNDDSRFTTELEQKLKNAIRRKYTPRHVPAYIFEVADIPYTMNGKKCEINVKHVVCGRDMAVSGAVANPEALGLYKRFRNLPSDQETLLNRSSKL